MRKRSIVLPLAIGVTAASLAACGGNAKTETTAATGLYTPGSYTGTAQGFGGAVSVEITTDAEKITAVKVSGDAETPSVGGAHLAELGEAIMKAQSAEIDAVSGATVTSDAVKEAAAAAIAQAKGESAPAKEAGPVSFTAGSYTGTAQGYNGPVSLKVSFSDSAVTGIEIESERETNHIGTPAYDILFADAIAANGSGIDSVSGATFTSRAVKEALNDAATQAKVSDLESFRKNTVKHEAQAPIEESYDVVIVGAGGAGMGAAVQAAQNGDSVIVVEKNAEIGGNTVASGGQFQSAQKYLVWDAENPGATSGEYKGVSYDKVKSAAGNITVLKTILDWNEAAFDASYFDKVEFVAGDITHLSKAGVHTEYRPTLQALKKEIKAYLDWAQPKLDAGEAETELPLFSTVNLHIFQTYYGGLRQNAEKTEWIYGNYDLVSQFVEGGQELKGWLEDQGALFDESIQPTIVGALWQRENDFLGSDLDGDGKPDADGANASGKTVWSTYFAPTKNTLLKTAANAADNRIMLRTDVDSLIVEDGRVVGVKGTQYDGTEVTLRANKGVILATGGYAANIERVMNTNDYWAKGSITSGTKTTNRSSLQGDGIDMAEQAGAATTGMGYTQLMPISWVDNGNLAFGGGNYAIYVSPETGERYVNETGERDVLSLGEYRNGVEYKGAMGTVLEIANSEQQIPGPYPYGTPKTPETWEMDVPDRQYTRTVDELSGLLKEFGFSATQEQIRKTIEDYDRALMTGTEDKLNVTKTGWTRLIGQAEKDDKGNYLPETYTLDGVKLKIRLLAPSTHHTMGGVVIDTDRHVLDASGKVIPGLYAAGEVTGGIHGGNRLGGNAIVEIFVSGRTAAQAIAKDSK